jgi:type I restriction enzyme, S subunit
MDPTDVWYGHLPPHWTWAPLKYLVTFTSGGTPSKENRAFWDGDVPWASSKDLKVEWLDDTEDHITQVAIDQGAAALVRAGSILIVVRGMILAHSFPVATVSRPMAINQDLKALWPKVGMTSEFLAWLLRGATAATLARIDEAGHGTKVVRMEKWASLPAPVPPLPEQAAIAAFLARETAKIDALVAEQERLMALLREKRQAVIAHAITKGINPDVPLKDSGVQWMGMIPRHWNVVQSRRLFRVRSEKARDGDAMLTASQKYGIIAQADFVRLEGRRVVEVIKGVDSLLHVEPDDFVISMRSFQGGVEWSTLRGSISFHYVMLTPNQHVVPRFFARLLKADPYIQALRKTTDLIRDGQELRFSHFVQVPLPLVPRSEQQSIADYLDEKTAEMDRLIEQSGRAIDLLRERRAAIITAAVTGGIDVLHLASTDAV